MVMASLWLQIKSQFRIKTEYVKSKIGHKSVQVTRVCRSKNVQPTLCRSKNARENWSQLDQFWHCHP